MSTTRGSRWGVFRGSSPVAAAPLLLAPEEEGRTRLLRQHCARCARRSAPRVRATESSRSTEFVTLGHTGSDHFAGLETFANPGVSHVEMVSDELAAVCPITGQPDLYVLTVEYWPETLCIESKSLKLYLNDYRNEAHFCEGLAVKIRNDIAEALKLPTDKVRVMLKQKARGGISITATA